VAINLASATQAQDACNACNGAGTCTDDLIGVDIGGGSAWVSAVATGSVYYVYTAGAIAPPASTCSPTGYIVSPGDEYFLTATTCPAGTF
jgi:hypothetical protein